MFGSEALEVGIGLIFIYLVLSLSVTASTEVLAALLRLRARVLRNSLINFLTEGPAGAFKRLFRTFNPLFKREDSLVTRLYDHPLIQTLQVSKHGPSYIPARTFALALLDVLDQAPDDPARLAALKNDLPAGWDRVAEPTLRLLVKIEAGFPLLYRGLRTLINEAVQDLALREQRRTVQDRLELAALEEKAKQLGTAATTLTRQAAVDLGVLREKVEVWFNASMDQVTGWYKRWAKFISFAVGLAIVLPLNADTLTLADALSEDDELRQAIVQQATVFAEENQRAFARLPAPPDTSSAVPADTLLARYDRALARQQRADSTLLALQSLGLPFGWEAGRYDCWWRSLFWTRADACSGVPFDGPWLKFFGLLVTALALTLGAPFWFDVLNKAINVRADASSPREVPRPPEAYPKREENIPPQ